MEKIITIKSRAVALNIQNIDTDQIIPARFLKSTIKSGFGENLFRDWRYDKHGNLKTDFVLNNSNKDSKILIAGKNFGCGSSREHAAWSLYDYGFRVIVSSFFADIFKNNALNNDLLPIQVTDSFLELIFETIDKNSDTEFEISLQEQTIRIAESNSIEHFFIPSHKKTNLMTAKDDIDYLLGLNTEIKAYEKRSKYKSIFN